MRRAALLLASLAATACARIEFVDGGDRPITLAEYYKAEETLLRQEGLLRTETAPPDAPFTLGDLGENFIRIAFNLEYRREGGELIEATTPTVLARWTQPIRYRILGASVTDQDEALIGGYLDRLAMLTGLEIEAESADPNIRILILTAAERRAFINDLEASGDAARNPILIEWASNPLYPCVGQVGFDDRASGDILGALIVIKEELKGLFRETCVHEELSQALGLFNDDPAVRPSIFNDDQEFALLTRHDELLLRILYDPRLSPGMAPEEARPILTDIIEELQPAAGWARERPQEGDQS